MLCYERLPVDDQDHGVPGMTQITRSATILTGSMSRERGTGGEDETGEGGEARPAPRDDRS
jgi:hypothetical protein